MPAAAAEEPKDRSINLRLPMTTFQRMAQSATVEHRSVNSMANCLLLEALDARAAKARRRLARST